MMSEVTICGEVESGAEAFAADTCEGSGAADSRVLRGGSWNNNNPRNLLSSYRNNNDPGNRNNNNGFRCVVVVSARKVPDLTIRQISAGKCWRSRAKRIGNLTRSTPPRNKTRWMGGGVPPCRGKDAVPARGPARRDHGLIFPPALLSQAPAIRRYTDDFLLFADDKERLWHAWNGIIGKLTEIRLRLAEPKSRLLRCAEGVPFCGFRFMPGLRPRVLGATKRRFEKRKRRLLESKAGLAELGKSVFAWYQFSREGNSYGLRRCYAARGGFVI